MGGGCILVMVPMGRLSIVIIGVVIGVIDGGGISAIMLSMVGWWLLIQCVRFSCYWLVYCNAFVIGIKIFFIYKKFKKYKYTLNHLIIN